MEAPNNRPGARNLVVWELDIRVRYFCGSVVILYGFEPRDSDFESCKDTTDFFFLFIFTIRQLTKYTLRIYLY